MAAAADVWQLRNFPSTLKTPRHDQTMKIHALLLALSSLTLAQPEGDALLPARWLEDIAATDNSIQRTLVFNAIAGVLYTVQSSENLNDWTSEETHYGLGHDILVPMFERTPPPPLPPGTPPTESPPRPICFRQMTRSWRTSNTSRELKPESSFDLRPAPDSMSFPMSDSKPRDMMRVL